MIGLVGGSTTLARCGRPCCLAAQGPRHLPKQQQQQQQRQARPRQRPCRSVNDVAATAVAAEGAAGSEQPPSADDSLVDETLDYVQHCQETYGCPGLIDFSEGHNGLPKATLQHPAGPSCEVYLHGAAVTSWRHADGREMLHLRESNKFDGSNPITGGIQIAWPQYGVGALPTHGFLQHLHWSVVDASWRERGEEEEEDDEQQQYDLDSQDGQLQADQSAESYIDWRPQLSLYASTDSEWEQKWPHKFEALYSITLQQPDPDEQSDVDVAREAAEQFQPWMKRRREEERRETEAAAAAASASAAAATSAAKQPAANAAAAAMAVAADDPDLPQPATPSVLSCLLQIHNCDETPFTFTTGLRTHLVTRDIPSHSKFVKVLGLRGKFILDYTRSALKPGLTVLDEHYVTFGDMVSQNRLFVDCDDEGQVLFCPGNPAHFNIGNAEGFKDIAIVHPAGIVPREARRFVEIDSARAVRKVMLQPGETWVGEMVLSAQDRYWDLPAWEAEDTSLVPLPDQTAELLQPNRTGGELTSEQLGAI